MGKRKVMDILQAAAAELGTEIVQDECGRYVIRYEYVDYYIITIRYKFWVCQVVQGYNGNLAEEEFNTMLDVVKGFYPECHGCWREELSFVCTPGYHCITDGKAISGEALGEILSRFFETWSFACANAFLLTDETIWGDSVTNKTDDTASDVTLEGAKECMGNDMNASRGHSVSQKSTQPSSTIVIIVQSDKDEDHVEVHFKDIVNTDGSVTSGRVQRVSKEEYAQMGCVGCFNEVAYVVMYCSLPLRRDGANTMDSSGQEDKTGSFAEADRQYFRDDFLGNAGLAAKIEKLLEGVTINKLEL